MSSHILQNFVQRTVLHLTQSIQNSFFRETLPIRTQTQPNHNSNSHTINLENNLDTVLNIDNGELIQHGVSSASNDQTLTISFGASYQICYFSKYISFLCILVLKCCYDNLLNVLDFSLLFLFFHLANDTLQKEVSKLDRPDILSLFRELFLIIVIVTAFEFMFPELEERNFHMNIFLAIQPNSMELGKLSLGDLIFAISTNDLILKLITVGLKISFTLLPSTWVDYRRRGRFYQLIESLSQLYRALVTTLPWLMFLSSSYLVTDKVFGFILTSVYIFVKGTDLLYQAKFVGRSLFLVYIKASYGTIPTKEQILDAGDVCSICHENFKSPVMMAPCGHIFCEVCIETWLDRAIACPLCRAKISKASSFRDGSTTYHIQLF